MSNVSSLTPPEPFFGAVVGKHKPSIWWYIATLAYGTIVFFAFKGDPTLIPTAFQMGNRVDFSIQEIFIGLTAMLFFPYTIYSLFVWGERDDKFRSEMFVGKQSYTLHVLKPWLTSRYDARFTDDMAWALMQGSNAYITMEDTGEQVQCFLKYSYRIKEYAEGRVTNWDYVTSSMELTMVKQPAKVSYHTFPERVQL